MRITRDVVLRKGRLRIEFDDDPVHLVLASDLTVDMCYFDLCAFHCLFPKHAQRGLSGHTFQGSSTYRYMALSCDSAVAHISNGVTIASVPTDMRHGDYVDATALPTETATVGLTSGQGNSA